MVWRIWKQKHKKVRLPKMHCSLFMLQDDWNIEHSLSIHLFYGRFYFLTLSYQMGKNVLTHTIQQLKGAGLFKLVCCFGSMSHEKVNKIHVHVYPLGFARNY